MKDISVILQNVGLSATEAKAYLGLLALKETKTGALCSHTGIASSNIYPVLDALVAKGLASYRIHNNTKIFIATSPETLHHLFLVKQEQLKREEVELKQAIAKLKVPAMERPQSQYKYYEGTPGVKALWQEIIDDLPSTRGDVKIYTGKKEAYTRLVGFYDEFHAARVKRGIKAQAIFPEEDKALGTKRNKQQMTVRYRTLANTAEWGVVGDKFYLQYTVGETPRAFLIEDPVFAETFRQVFDQVWGNE